MSASEVFSLVLYDGDCGFCTASADFAKRHLRDADVRFAPLASDVGRAALKAHGFAADYAESVVVIEGGRAYTESAATLRLARHLRWPWRAAVWGKIIPSPLRDAAYRWVARHRGKFPGGGGVCSVPGRD
ncbi:MAG TPA: DCC1-like thiol-disulfide oxidoreductase family protein [Tepidisphaeraceae bacterium]|jgi:predicted DCC family thiol-disulfide oxidoreductase YuxK